MFIFYLHVAGFGFNLTESPEPNANPETNEPAMNAHHKIQNWSNSSIVERLAHFSRSAHQRKFQRDGLEMALEGELVRRVGLREALRLVDAEVDAIDADIVNVAECQAAA